MDFGNAIKAMSYGERVQRTGWNGKGMFIFYVSSEEWTFTNGKWDNFPLEGFIAMKTAQGTVIPWLASQADMMADDWEEL